MNAAIVAVLALCSGSGAWAADFYSNYAGLAAQEKEGVDYRVVTDDRSAAVTVMAIHGGRIEPGASELATAVAGGEHNRYLFEGIKPAGNIKLHVTSTHFDEPRALAMAKRSKFCVSIHGYGARPRDVACVGGGSAVLRRTMARELQGLKLGFELVVEQPCERFAGSDPRNIVNRCAEPGVQLELSSSLRRRALADPAVLRQLAAAMRRGISLAGLAEQDGRYEPAGDEDKKH